MSQTLSEIVSSALRQADASIKVASLRDAPIEDRSFSRVDQYLARELGQVEPETQKEASATEQPADFSGGYNDIEFAFKLASALEHGANVLAKLAGPLNKSDGGPPKSGPVPAAGPAPIQPPLYDRATTATPMPQASAHARAAQANDKLEPEGNPETDRDMQLNEGPVIPRNYPTSKVPTTGASSKHASLDRVTTQRLLRSKIAQHKMLVSLGQIDAANAVLKEAQELASGAPHDHSDLVFKDDYTASKFPDNNAVRALTKAQARDMNQREAGNFFGEPVKRDNAATAHLAVTDGLKLSMMPLSQYKLATGEVGFVQGLGKKIIGGGRAALRGAGSGARKVERSYQPDNTVAGLRMAKTKGHIPSGIEVGGLELTPSAVHPTPTGGPVRDRGRVERGARWLREKANKGRQSLGEIGETGQKVVGGTALGLTGAGAAYGGHRLLRGGRED